jgi:hypothetical protein
VGALDAFTKFMYAVLACGISTVIIVWIAILAWFCGPDDPQ